MKLQNLIRKVKYAIFIPKRITRKPNSSKSVISDLFCIRSDEKWTTFFEGLNIPGLIQGNNSKEFCTEAIFVFFDKDGTEVFRKSVVLGKMARTTIELNDEFVPKIANAATFSVFHLIPNSMDLDLGASFIAERGYAGFANSHSGVRGYVHGNLDALAYEDGNIEMLGNKGIFSRMYTVQHVLHDESVYELFLANPCRRPTKIEIQVRLESGKWQSQEKFKLRPRASRLVRISIAAGESRIVRVKSHLYIGRPVVFRNSEFSFDVFHG